MDPSQSLSNRHHDEFLRIYNPSGYTDVLLNQPVCAGVFLREYHCVIENFVEIEYPAILEHIVVFQTRGAANFKRWIGKPSQNYTSLPEDLGIVPGNLAASTWLQQGDFNVIHLYIQPDLIASTAIEALDTDPAGIEFKPVASFHDPLMFAVAAALREEILSGGYYARLYTEALIHPLLIRILRKYIVFPHEPTPLRKGISRWDLRRVIEFIHGNLASDLTLAELAQVASLSPYHLTRLFKQVTGQPLHQYVIYQRVAAAQRLILAGQDSLSEVAQEVGFADQSHMTRNFKRLVGVSPGALLQESKNIQENSKFIQD